MSIPEGHDEYSIMCKFRGSNFLTPHVIEYGVIKEGLYYELSKGKNPFNDGMLYGVSIANDRGHLGGDERAGCFYTLFDARAHIEALKQDLTWL